MSIGNLMCGHRFKPGVYCGLGKKHGGVHIVYKCVGGGEKPCFHIIEWNDDRETMTGPREEGVAFFAKNSEGAAGRSRALKEAIAEGMKHVPEGEVFEIRERTPGDFAKYDDWAVAWYFVPKQPKGFNHSRIAQEPLFINDAESGVLVENGSHKILARIKSTGGV